MYVSEFRLDDYPVAPEATSCTPERPRSTPRSTPSTSASSTSGFASIGICEHAFYEAVTHADDRVLYGKRVTDFPHVRQGLTDAYARLVAMKLFGERAIDYFRSASADDRRYLLFNPVTKMKVTTEGERVIDGLWDVIAAKGFEKDTYFEQAAMDIRALPKLEGTVHVNMALVLKFLPQLPAAADRRSPTCRGDATRPTTTFLFHQGPARGLGAIRLRATGERRTTRTPTCRTWLVFREQAEGLVDARHQRRSGRGAGDATSTCCSRSASCSRSSSTAS